MKRRRLCSLLLAGSLIITSLSSSYSTTAAEEFSTDSIVQEDNTEITTEDIPADIQLVTEVDNTTEQAINETTSSEEIIEDSSSEEILSDNSSEDISTEEITSEITKEDTDSSEEITEESTDNSTENLTDESTEESTEKSVLNPSFTEKVAGISTTGLDFSSKELLVGTEDPTIFTWDTNVISEYNGVYLIRFEDVETTEIAYTYYFTKADFISPNITFTVADNNYVNDDSNQDENVADLSNLNQGDDAISILNDLDSIKTPNKTIALIDTGVNADDLVGSVSVIGDDTSDDNGHGTRMYNYIKEEAHNAKILSIKALDKDGYGTADSIYAAIQYAIESKVGVINLSLSANSIDKNNIVVQAIKEAIDKNIIVVGSAGNTGSNAKYFIPGCIEEAIIVGACDENGHRISNSNYGKTVDYNIVADSTSEATARMSGIISSNSGKSIIYKALIDEHLDDITEYKYEHNNFVINNDPSKRASGDYPYVRREKRDGNTVIFRQYNKNGTVTANSPNVTVSNVSTNALCVNFDWKPGEDGYEFDVNSTTITDADTKQLLYNIVIAINNGSITYGDGHRLMCYAFGNDKITPSNITAANRHGGNSSVSGFSSKVSNASTLITTYLNSSHKIPENISFTVKYLTNRCKPSSGTYQNFISWNITTLPDYYAAVFKIDEGEQPLAGATFNFRSGKGSGTNFGNAVTGSDGIAVIKLGTTKPAHVYAKETKSPNHHTINSNSTGWYECPIGTSINSVKAAVKQSKYTWVNTPNPFYIKIKKDIAIKDAEYMPSMAGIRYALFATSALHGYDTSIAKDDKIAEFILKADGTVNSVELYTNSSDKFIFEIDSTAPTYLKIQPRSITNYGSDNKAKAGDNYFCSNWLWLKETQTNNNYKLNTKWSYIGKNALSEGKANARILDVTATSTVGNDDSAPSEVLADRPVEPKAYFVAIQKNISNETNKTLYNLPIQINITNNDNTVQKKMASEFFTTSSTGNHKQLSGNFTIYTGFYYNLTSGGKSYTQKSTDSTTYNITSLSSTYPIEVNRDNGIAYAYIGRYYTAPTVTYKETWTTQNTVKYVKTSDTTEIIAATNAANSSLFKLDTTTHTAKVIGLNYQGKNNDGLNAPNKISTLSNSVTKPKAYFAVIDKVLSNDSNATMVNLPIKLTITNNDTAAQNTFINDNYIIDGHETPTGTQTLDVKTGRYYNWPYIKESDTGEPHGDENGQKLNRLDLTSTDSTTTRTFRCLGSGDDHAITVTRHNGRVLVFLGVYYNKPTVKYTENWTTETNVYKLDKDYIGNTTDAAVVQANKDDYKLDTTTHTMDGITSVSLDFHGTLNLTATNIAKLTNGPTDSELYYISVKKYDEEGNLLEGVPFTISYKDDQGITKTDSVVTGDTGIGTYEFVGSYTATTKPTNITITENWTDEIAILHKANGSTKEVNASDYIHDTTPRNCNTIYTSAEEAIATPYQFENPSIHTYYISLKKTSIGSNPNANMNNIKYRLYDSYTNAETVKNGGTAPEFLTFTLDSEGKVKTIEKGSAYNLSNATDISIEHDIDDDTYIFAKLVVKSNVANDKTFIDKIENSAVPTATTRNNFLWLLETDTNSYHALNNEIFGPVVVESNEYKLYTMDDFDELGDHQTVNVSMKMKKSSSGYPFSMAGIKYRLDMVENSKTTNIGTFTMAYDGSVDSVNLIKTYLGEDETTKYANISTSNGYINFEFLDGRNVSDTTDFLLTEIETNDYYKKNTGVTKVSSSALSAEEPILITAEANIDPYYNNVLIDESLVPYYLVIDKKVDELSSTTNYPVNGVPFIITVLDNTNPELEELPVLKTETVLTGNYYNFDNNTNIAINTCNDSGTAYSTTYVDVPLTKNGNNVSNKSNNVINYRINRTDGKTIIYLGMYEKNSLTCPIKVNVQENWTTETAKKIVYNGTTATVTNITSNKFNTNYSETDIIPLEMPKSETIPIVLPIPTGDNLVESINEELSVNVQLIKSSGINDSSSTYQLTHNVNTSTGTGLNNPNYSLAGATYDIYNSDDVKLGSVVCGADGISNILDISEDFLKDNEEGLFSKDYIAKEKTAGKNYVLDTKEHVITVTKDNNINNPAVFNVYDDITTDPLVINVEKRSDLSGDPISPETTLNAQYKISYYPAEVNSSHYYTAAELKASGIIPETATITLSKNGTKYEASTNAITDHSMGYIIIEELVAPHGYNIEGSTYTITLANGSTVTLNPNEIPVFIIDRISSSDSNATIKAYLLRDGQRKELQADKSTGTISIISKDKSEESYDSELLSSTTGTHVGYINGSTSTTDSVIETFGITGVPKDNTLTYKAKLIDKNTNTQVVTSNGVATDGNKVVKTYTSTGVARQTFTIDFGTFTPIAGHTYASVVEVYGKNDNGALVLKATHNENLDIASQEVYYGTLSTNLLSSNNTKVGSFIQNETLVDTITYSNFPKGSVLKFEGDLYDITDSSNPVKITTTSEYANVTISNAKHLAEDTVSLTFNYDARAYAGRTITAKVRVSVKSSDTSYIPIIQHNILGNDISETVYYPTLSSRLVVSSTGTKLGITKASDSAVETAYFTNVPKDVRITFTSELYDVTTGTPVLLSTSSGSKLSTGLTQQSVALPAFTYDSRELAGHKLSAKLTAKVNNVVVGVHNADYTVEDETIYYPSTSTTLLTNNKKYGTVKANDSAIETVAFTNYPANTVLSFHATLYDVTAGQVIATNNDVSKTSSSIARQTATIPFSYDSTGLAGHKLSAKVEVYVGTTLVDTHNASYNVEDETIYYPNPRTVAVSNTTGTQVGLVGTDRIKETIYFSGYKIGDTVSYIARLVDITDNSTIQTTSRTSVTITSANQTADVLFNNFTAKAGHTYSAAVRIYTDNNTYISHNESYNIVDETVYYPSLSTLISKKVGTISTTESVSDTVTYSNFPEGTVITFNADLVDTNTNAVVATNNTVTVTSTGLTAKTATIPFTYDSTGLAGHKLSVRVTAKVSGTSVVPHNTALNAEDETIYYPITSTVLLTNGSKFGIPKVNDSARERVTFTNYPAGTAITFRATLKDLDGTLLVNETATATSTGLGAQEKDITFNYNSSALNGHRLSAKVEVLVGGVVVDTHNTDYDVEDETIYYQSISTYAVSNTTNGKVGIVGSDRIKDTITFSGYPAGTSITFVSTLRDITSNNNVQTITTSNVISTGLDEQTQDVLFSTFTPVANHRYAVKTIIKVAGTDDIIHNSDYSDNREMVYYPQITTLISKKLGAISANETVSDTVTFRNFPSGTVITFKADLVDVNTNTVIATNNTVTATSTGVSAQTATIPFTYDSRNLRGHKLSVKVIANVSGNDVVNHNVALTTEDETIYYPQTSTELLTNGSKFGSPKQNDSAVETVTFSNYPAGTVITFKATLRDLTGTGSVTAEETVTSTGLTAQTADITFNYNSRNRGGHKISAKVDVYVNDVLVDTHNGSYDVEKETIYYPTMSTVAVSNTTNGKIGIVGSDKIKETITFNGYPAGTSIVFVSTLRDITANTDIQTKTLDAIESTGLETQTTNVLFDTFTPVAGHTYSVKSVAKVTGYADLVHNDNYNIVDETVYYPAITSLVNKKVGTISTNESLSDTVTFSNFPEGTNITFKATLTDVTANNVIATNNTVTATSTGLTAQTVNIPFTYDSTTLAGHKLSVKIVATVSGTDVVTHNASYNVEDETLYYPITDTELLTNGKKFGQAKTGDSAVETVSFTNYPAGTSITFNATLKDLNTGGTQTRTTTVTSEGLQTQTKDITFTYNSSNCGGHKLSAKVEVVVGGVVVDTHNADYTVEKETIYYPTISSVAVTNSMNGKIGVVGTDKVKETITFAGYPEGTNIIFETILRDITAGTNVETINKSVTSTGITSQTADVVFSNFNAMAGHTYSVKVTSKVTGYNDLVHNGNYNVIAETVYYPNLTTLISKKVGTITTAESITDTVTFSNVPADTNLTFNADLVDVATGNVIASNNTVTASSTGLTAQNVTIPFTYDSRNLAGKTLSVRVTAKVSGTDVVSHNIELNTENETIYYPTFATDLLSASTSNKLGSQKTNETARETVTFSNVPAGTVLTVVGELYDVTSTATPIDTITGTITSSGTQEQTVAITDLFEFDSTLLENTTLAAKLIVKIGNNVIATHNNDLSDVREKIYYMSTDTELLSTYGTHYYKAGKVTASENSRETIKIKNVPVGTILTYTATLADVSDHNAPIKVVNGTYTSTTLEEQTIQVNFTNYDARGLAGHTLSAKVEFNIGNNLVGSHNTDYSDLKETIYYPTGHTTAADKDTTTKLASDSTTATIYDDFYFENLAKGVTYTITGVVHKRNNSTGADDGVLTYKEGSTTKEVSKTITLEVKADGTIVAPNAESYEITSSTDGTVTGKVRLAFTLDASLLEGITTTVFETVSVDNMTVFTHSNINDDDQQIHFMKLYTLLKSNSTNKSIGAIVANETATDVLYFEKVPFGSSILFNGTLKYKDTQADFTTANVTLNVSNTGVATSSSGIATDVTYVVDNATKTVTGTIKLVYSYNSTGLKNKTLVSFVTAKQNNVVVALHEDINDTDETVYYPDIHTNAKDANTMSNVSKLGTTQIIDTVTLNNLIVGNTYVVTGTVNVKNADGSYGGIATKKVNNVDTQITKSVTITISDAGRITLGNGITNSTLTVTGKTVNGTIDITFDVDNTNYLGKDFVVYENLYTDNILLVAHNDLTDILQTIHNPSGSTQAMDSQTQDEVGTVVENGTITLVDTVSLNNLPVGKTYRVDGIIKDKATGENVKNGNSNITSSVTFTVNANGTITAVSPATIVSQVTSFDNTNGTINCNVQMNFTVPSSTLANKDVVVFESGYVVVNNTSSVLVFEEKELSELTQTVHFPDITSIATDDTYQKHIGIVSERNAITEKATLYNLVYGKTYTFKASLMDQITRENLKKSNANIEKTITVTVSATGVVTAKDEANQSITVTTTKYDTDKTVDTVLSIPFVYDSTSVSGKAIVVFGELSHNNIIVKTHNDIDNILQQIHYYELDVKKKNLTDASYTTFNVKHNNELVKFVKVSDGVYNIVIGDVNNSVTEISPLHSTDPNEDGKLIIKGFEDGTYVFTEIKTENGKSLLEDAFSVIFDPTSAEHGKLKDLRVSTSDKSATLTSTDATKPNVMAIDIINNDIVQLEAGGSGTTIYYIIGGIILLIALLLIGFFIYKKKKESKDNKTE